MVVFGSEQGLSNFETDGMAVTAIAVIASYVEDFKRAKRRSGPEDAVCGRTLTKTATLHQPSWPASPDVEDHL